MKNKNRHLCSSCRRKIYEFKMYRYYYPLLGRMAWHCKDCVKTQKWDLATLVQAPNQFYKMSTQVDN